MARWAGQVYSFGGNTDAISDGSATVQLSLVDSSLKDIKVTNSHRDFIMYIPIAEDEEQEHLFTYVGK